MRNQPFFSDSLERWRNQIERLRKVQDLPAPWEVYPEIPQYAIGWRMGSGEDVMVDWQCWIRSLNPKRRAEYQDKHPEPESWRGFYAMIFSGDSEVLKGLEGDAYWDAKLAYLKKQLENPKLEAFYQELAKLPNDSSVENYNKFLALVESFKKGKTNC